MYKYARTIIAMLALAGFGALFLLWAAGMYMELMRP